VAEVIGSNDNGIGVSGTGGTYGVYGASTGAACAGIVGKNGPNSTAPGVYAQTVSPAPGLLAISGLATFVDALFSTNLDAAAVSWGQKYPNKAALFIGDVALTGAVAGATCAFQGNNQTAVSGVTSGSSSYGVSAVNNGPWPCVAMNAASDNGHGVHGTNQTGAGSSPQRGCGIWGESKQGYGVYGASASSTGVYGASQSGLAGEFAGNVSVSGKLETQAIDAKGNVSVSGKLEIQDIAATGSVAGKDFTVTGDIDAQGNIKVKGDVFLTGADCAELFDLSADEIVEPGTVMVIDETGALRTSSRAYDRAVAGVVSGAGAFRPAIVLDQRAGDGEGRAAIALVGKVYCKVDANASGIAVGDLLTTSDRPGHAMKLADPLRGFGAVIGKALKPMASGQGLLPILVALQ
jgi:hypothetical protein